MKNNEFQIINYKQQQIINIIEWGFLIFTIFTGVMIIITNGIVWKILFGIYLVYVFTPVSLLYQQKSIGKLILNDSNLHTIIITQNQTTIIAINQIANINLKYNGFKGDFYIHIWCWYWKKGICYLRINTCDNKEYNISFVSSTKEDKDVVMQFLMLLKRENINYKFIIRI